MTIVAVGAGAMGCLFGARLARAGEAVVLLDPSPEKADFLRSRGIVLHDAAGTETIPVAAATKADALGPVDLVLVCVKAPQTRHALPATRALCGPRTRVLTLQNGLGAADLLAQVLPPEQLLVGTTAQGATLLGPGEVRHGGNGPTVFGPYQTGDPVPYQVAETFRRAGFEASAVADPWPAVWKKLAVNCGINAVTALTGIRNGRIPEIPAAAALSRAAVAEANAAARAEGVDLGGDDELGDAVLAVARATAANRSSMGQDVDRGRPTEVDCINGAVVRIGERHGIPTPVNRTLTQLIRTLEATLQR